MEATDWTALGGLVVAALAILANMLTPRITSSYAHRKWLYEQRSSAYADLTSLLRARVQELDEKLLGVAAQEVGPDTGDVARTTAQVLNLASKDLARHVLTFFHVYNDICDHHGSAPQAEQAVKLGGLKLLSDDIGDLVRRDLHVEPIFAKLRREKVGRELHALHEETVRDLLRRHMSQN